MYIKGNPKPETVFPHQKHTGPAEHIQDSGNCIVCHMGVDEWTESSSSYIPGKEVCVFCHLPEDERPKKIKLRPRTDSVIHFSHKWHVGNLQLNCMQCHENVITNDYLPARGGLPKMEVCAACHFPWVSNSDMPNNVRREKCLKCHKEKIMPRNHYENWLEIHRVQAVARFDEECSSCHAEKTNCTNCHAGGFFKPVSHDMAWIQTHRFSVRNQVQNCKSCHSDDSCQDCHRTHGVSGTKDFRRRINAGIHPPGWNSDLPGTGNHHSLTARYKLDTCKACHQPSDCQSCHFPRQKMFGM
ncbi:MAG: hypothetical protein OEZ34_15665 [Spirochaetia bacterium]|nr:hypothetical protein [Spirochaetia bacterium]